jgi:hypothetical protein
LVILIIILVIIIWRKKEDVNNKDVEMHEGLNNNSTEQNLVGRNTQFSGVVDIEERNIIQLPVNSEGVNT